MILSDLEIEDMISATFADNYELTSAEHSMIRATEKAVANKIFAELFKAFDWALPDNASEETKLEHEVDRNNVEFLKQVMWEYGLKIPR